MIASTQEIALVEQGRCTSLWLPVVRGSVNQRRACPVEVGTCVSLQPRPFVKGTKITIAAPPVLRAFEPFDNRDAKAMGHFNTQVARAAWERSYGRVGPETEVWVVSIVLGDRTAFFRAHEERFLRAKMGGARPYTSDPEKALGGIRSASLHSVPYADEMRFAEGARLRREREAREALQDGLAVVKREIAQMSSQRNELDESARKDLDWMRRRARQIERRLLSESVV